MLGVAVTALASSIARFAFSAICGAILFHFGDDPVRLVQIMITCSIANQAAMTWAGRESIEWRGLSAFLAGSLPGVAAGVWLLVHADRHVYTRVIGALPLGYGAYMLLRKPITIKCQRVAFDVVAGFLGGITEGASGTPGAPVSIWCATKG